MARRRYALALTSMLLGNALLPRPAAEAQGATPDPSYELQLLESTERALDPLGIDDSTGKSLDEAAQALTRAREKAAAQPKPKNIVTGQVLSGLDAVAESAHDVRVQLSQGLAFVRVAMRFESRSEEPAEVAYRLPLPDGAAIHRVRVCRAKSCRDALPNAQPTRDTSNPLEPFVWAMPIYDARGAALSLRAGAVQKSAPLEVTLEYVAEAPVHGGSVRIRLPARGYDDRIAAAQLTLSVDPGFRASQSETVSWDAWQSFEVSAQLEASPAPKRTSASCGGRTCVREWRAAAPAPAAARDTWLVLDASHSMEGEARNAGDLVLTALLAALPPESPLRVLAFGTRAREVGRVASAQLAPLKLLSDGLMSDLGAASRPGAALKLAKSELTRGRPLVLILSDAKWDAAALRELREAKTAQSELWLLLVGPDAPADLRAFDGVIDLRDLRLSYSSAERNEERLRAPFSRIVRKQLRSGEQHVSTQGNTSFVPRAGESWLSFWLSNERPSFATSARPVALIAALPFSSSPAPAPAAATSMPKESVLTMLRTQLIPEARSCLRTDRKGRANYAVALTFHALFADREAYDVRIEGKLPAALEKCLLELVGTLRIPAFNGRIRVRYPIHTEREAEPPVIELMPEARDSVDRVLKAP